MRFKDKQRGFIQIPILIAIAIGVAITGGTGATYFEYKNLSSEIAKSDELSQGENYVEAITSLESAKKSWLVNTVGLKRDLLENKLQEVAIKKQHYEIFQQALEKESKSEWQEAIDVLSEIPEDSFYSQRAKLKTEESKGKILEQKLGVAQVARAQAEQKASQEATKRAAEEIARKQAEQREANERLAKEHQERETEIQKQRADQERLAKEQQERETTAQRLRAEEEEKAKYLHIAKTNPLVRAVVSGELNFYIEPIPSYAADGVDSAVEEIASILSSFSEADFYDANFKRVYNGNNADLYIGWVKDYGEHTLGQAIFQSHVKVGLGTQNCYGEWRPFDANTVKKVLWHELGHSMGYEHSNDSNNIMYHKTSTRFESDRMFTQLIASSQFYYPKFCSGGSYEYLVKSDSTLERFDLYIIPPEQDPQETSIGGGEYYPSCSKENTTSYQTTCNVPNGARMFIQPSSGSSVTVSGVIVDKNNSPWPDMGWDEDAFQNQYDLDEIWKLFH